MDYTQSETWKRTLGDGDGSEEDLAPRESLRLAYEQFRKSVIPLAKEVALSVPGYTDHSIEHCDALWDTADLIVGPEVPLTPAEGFVLGGSFLIHDLAMGLAAYRGGLQEILTSEGWKDLLWADWPEAAPYLQGQVLTDVAKNPTWDGITSQEVKASLTTFLREHHAEEAEELLKRQWTLESGEPHFLLQDSELRHIYSEVIGKVARSHWLDAAALPDYLPRVFGAPATYPSSWTVDPVKVACILRLADAAQIDARRAHPLHTPFRQPQGASRPHWQFQELMLRPRVSQGRLVFTSARAFGPDIAEAWWLAFDTIQMVNGELQTVDSLLADLNMPRFRCKSVAGASQPGRLAKHIGTAGWQPIDARPRIGNPIGIIESLGGRALYGDEDDVAVRELLANAADATRAKKAALGGDASVSPIEISFESKGDDFFLVVRDYGIGMTAEDIEKFLCDFGTSGWRSRRFRAEYPGALASGYTSTGQFGIGFFSCFMIADDVQVVSRSLQANLDDTYHLAFSGGLEGRPILRKAERSERLMDAGTRVVLRLNEDPRRPNGLLGEKTPLDVQEQVEFIRDLVFTCDQAVRIKPLGSDVWQDVTDGSPWYERSAAEIFAAAHWNEWEAPLRHDRAKSLEYFERMVSPIRSDKGEVVGMLCVDPFADEGLSLNDARTYCNGFRAGFVSGFVGVVEGSPETASRDGVHIPVSIEALQSWMEDQWQRFTSVAQSDAALMGFHSLSLGVGVERPDVPIAWTPSGFLSPGDLETWIGMRDTFSVITLGTPKPIDVPGFGVRLYANGQLLALGEDVLVLSYHGRDPRDGFAEVPFESPFEVLPPVGPNGFDPDFYWYTVHAAGEGSVVRAASRAWSLGLDEVLLGVSEVNRDDWSPTDLEPLAGLRPSAEGVRFVRRV